MPPQFWAWLGQATWKQFVVKVIINIAISALINKLTQPKDKKDSLRSFTVIIRGTTEHQRIIYGETLAGGLLWYINTAGESNKALYQAVVVAGHEIDDITDMWIDDNIIPNADIDWGIDGKVTGGDYRGDFGESHVVYFYKHLGDAGQVAMPELITAFAEINSSHIGAGQAGFVSRFDYFLEQAQVWSAGVPHAVRGLARGKKIYDPRLDDTQPFGFGDHRLANSLSWEWSDNPALCWADYMIDSNLGFGESSSKIDYSYVASAAAICEETVYLPVGTSDRFSCNGTLVTVDTYEENIKRILSSMGGQAVIQNGVWKVRAWGYETPTLQFTDDDLRGDIKINLHPEENARYNFVKGLFVDKDRLWKRSEFPVFTSSEYLSRDNDTALNRDISLHMTKENYMAQRLAAAILEQSDKEVSVVYPSNFKTLPGEVGGTIMVSNTKMGWSDKVFRIERFNFKDMEGIDLLLREDNSASYVDVGSNEYTVSSNGAYVVSDPGVPAPSSLTADGRLEMIKLQCTPPAPRLFEYISFYAAYNNSRDQANVINKSKSDSYLYPVQTQTFQYFWVRAENYAGEMSNFFPNSDQTNVISTVNSALALVFSDSSAVTTLSSDWTSAVNLISAAVNPGGDFNFRTDITAEANLYHKAAMDDTGCQLRLRTAVGTPDNWSTIGVVRQTNISSRSPDWPVMKRNYQSNINTNHYFALQAIANYNQASEWIANSYSNITLKLVPQERTPGAFTHLDVISVTDNIIADKIVGALVLTLTNYSNNAFKLGSDARLDFKIDQDGNMYFRKNVGSWVQFSTSDDWGRPTDSAPGTIWARYTNATGDPMFGTAAEDTWYELSGGDFAVWIIATNPLDGALVANFDLELRDGPSGAADETGAFQMTAERQDL